LKSILAVFPTLFVHLDLIVFEFFEKTKVTIDQNPCLIHYLDGTIGQIIVVCGFGPLLTFELKVLFEFAKENETLVGFIRSWLTEIPKYLELHCVVNEVHFCLFVNFGKS
jgi:hypothetical protein